MEATGDEYINGDYKRVTSLDHIWDPTPLRSLVPHATKHNQSSNSIRIAAHDARSSIQASRNQDQGRKWTQDASKSSQNSKSSNPCAENELPIYADRSHAARDPSYAARDC
ncbi:hypothetical protein A2U01_0000296 [Trifolium medium]|uniref:Uncharacterized protein n=2 Tax=Trifolium medium TaxID=97028 RepID=A0A392LXE6_9FABA|nr:hypothetical protein [Trifolium medium]